MNIILPGKGWGMGSHSRTMAHPSPASLGQSSDSNTGHRLERQTNITLIQWLLVVSWFLLTRYHTTGQQTIECLRERGICHCHTVPGNLTLLIVGHHKQQVAGFSDGNVIIAALVNTFWWPGNIKWDLEIRIKQVREELRRLILSIVKPAPVQSNIVKTFYIWYFLSPENLGSPGGKPQWSLWPGLSKQGTPANPLPPLVRCQCWSHP